MLRGGVPLLMASFSQVADGSSLVVLKSSLPTVSSLLPAVPHALTD